VTGAVQAPPLQTAPTAVQSVHVEPGTEPQAVSSAPMVQTPFTSQHPVHVLAQLEAAVGGLQMAKSPRSVMGRVGTAASGPQVSPRARHSASDEQSWIGPMGVEGHGPTWQLVVIWVEPQHTVPRGHAAALVQGMPPDMPPLLELPPLAPPPLVEPPHAVVATAKITNARMWRVPIFIRSSRATTRIDI
jgi:hypothetical protein